MRLKAAHFAAIAGLIGTLCLPLAVTGANSAQAASDQVTATCANTSFARNRQGGFAERVVQPAATGDPITRFTSQGGFGPADLLNAYNLPDSATTATVSVIDAFDDPSAESDLAVYRAHYGLPACNTANGCFTKMNQNGQSAPLPVTDSGWASETSLDLDMVSAVCPSCHILLVEADSAGPDLFVAVQQGVLVGAKYVSMSWGGPGMSTNPVFNTLGVAFVASSGDDNFGVNYPAASPGVLAVGGTSLNNAGNARGWAENVWHNSSNGPGSGCSTGEAKPSYQSAIPNSVCAGRAVTDVSAVADPYTGVSVYDAGQWAVFGGTSAAAPIIAATYALAGTPAAGTVPASYPYNHPEYLNDVTSGSNGSCGGSALCTAGTGWDGPSGLGTPNGTGAFSATGTEAARTAVPVPITPVIPVGPTAPAPTAPAPAPIGTAPVATAPVPVPIGTAPVAAAPVAAAPVAAAPVSAAPVSGSPSCVGQRVVNPSFASSRGWSATKAVLRRGSARLDGYGNIHTDRLSQAIVLPRGCPAILRVSLTISTRDNRAAADRLSMTVNGRVVALLTNRSRSGVLSLNLSRYAGQRIVLSFTGVENATQPTAFTIRGVSITS